MRGVLTMQDAILRLTAYWVEQGAVLAQPYNTEVGAGTLNPATFLRVLGPEPWRTAYVEPSVRPDDSRYGENPNRLQTHTQFQVIVKPDPGDPQEQYLGSIRALGIDTGRHDVRFVEDNWESPALGAWGLGWEVWLDGLEITQFTYFQVAGGQALEPVSVEITYGLERIVMALQGVDHFKNIQFAPGISYGEIAAQAELEDEHLLPGRGRCRGPAPALRDLPGGGGPVAGKAPPGPGVPLRPQVFPDLQRARFPRRHRHHRASPGVRPYAPDGSRRRRPVGRATGGAGLPARCPPVPSSPLGGRRRPLRRRPRPPPAGDRYRGAAPRRRGVGGGASRSRRWRTPLPAPGSTTGRSRSRRRPGGSSPR